MFDNLTERLNRTILNLRGKGRLSEENIQEAIKEVRMALLEADVALPVVRDFVDHVRQRAIGQEVTTSLTPGQVFVRIVQEELVKVLGGETVEINLRTQPPAVIMLAGLQGAGKTTTAAKLAKYLKERLRKRVLLASCDIYRPAAIQQLETLAGQVGAEFFPSETTEDPADIARRALEHARRKFLDVVIVDTAGRLHIDEAMMDEAKRVHAAVNPIETLFVVDSMTGQDAANTAKAFDEALPLTGVVLTKIDGDARGGAALSIRQITGKPIKLMGIGEKTDALEPFHPDRLASRILGMGDVLTLVEEVERTADKEKADKLARKLQKGKGLTLSDYRDQLNQMMNLGGVKGIMEKLPGAMQMPEAAKSQVGDRDIRRMIAIINSMTALERRRPEIIKASRKRRIANGSGTQLSDVNRLLKQFSQTQKMMKRFSKGGMAKLMRGGRLPPGMGF
ncbi:MAG: signal recognition particle protein [Pseudomonadota bacterium]|nr:signal recognition particle protein [Pseudomonadota bacterium]